jgi:hypothetical protein
LGSHEKVTVPFPVCPDAGDNSVTDVGPPLVAADDVPWLSVLLGPLVSVGVSVGGLGVNVHVGVADALGNGVEVANAVGPGWADARIMGDEVGKMLLPASLITSVGVPASGLGVGIRVGMTVAVGVGDALGNGVEVANAAVPGWADAPLAGDVVGTMLLPASETVLAAASSWLLTASSVSGSTFVVSVSTSISVAEEPSAGALAATLSGTGSIAAKGVAVNGTSVAVAAASSAAEISVDRTVVAVATSAEIGVSGSAKGESVTFISPTPSEAVAGVVSRASITSGIGAAASKSTVVASTDAVIVCSAPDPAIDTSSVVVLPKSSHTAPPNSSVPPPSSRPGQRPGRLRPAAGGWVVGLPLAEAAPGGFPRLAAAPPGSLTSGRSKSA